MSAIALLLCFGCSPRRTPVTRSAADPVSAAIVDFLSMRISDYGDSYTLIDDVTGERLNLAVTDLRKHSEDLSGGRWRVGVQFAIGRSSDGGTPEIDFWVERTGDALVVAEYRVHQAARWDGERWVLEDRNLPAGH